MSRYVAKVIYVQKESKRLIIRNQNTFCLAWSMTLVSHIHCLIAMARYFHESKFTTINLELNKPLGFVGLKVPH
jgi:hypothetical protein